MKFVFYFKGNVVKKCMCCIKVNILNYICIMNYFIINSFDFFCGYFIGNSDFLYSFKINL